MPKFIQILSHGGSLYGLDASGEVWKYATNYKQVCEGDPDHEVTEWEVTMQWERVEDKTLLEDRMNCLPF